MDDVVQQCLASVANAMATFTYDPGKGTFRGWIRTLTDRKIVDSFRRHRMRELQTADPVPLADSAESPDRIWARCWQREHLRYCLEQIRPRIEEKTYHVFEMYALTDHSADEVAHRFGITPNQVWVIKSRVLKHLRASMSELFGSEEAAY